MSVYLTALALAAQITPSTAADASDARCVLALIAIEPHVTAEYKAAMHAGTMFFVGKLLGRGGNDGAITAISAQERTFDTDTASDLAVKCADEMQKTGSILKAAGE